jgi:acyl transferase domain-containing protein
VVLEQAPSLETKPSSRAVVLLPFSAVSPDALENQAANLRGALNRYHDDQLADAGWTLQTGRRTFAWRHFVSAATTEEARRSLEKWDKGCAQRARTVPPRVVFLFSGQGSQHPAMAQELYLHEPTFRMWVDRCAELLRAELGGRDIREVIRERDGAELTRTEFAQPALFAIEYSLAQLWLTWGIRPDACIGHSLGEYVAACLCGVMDLATALKVVAVRGRLMQSAPAGGMLAAPIGEEDALLYLEDDVELAAVNAPDRCVLTGPAHAINDAQSG